MRFFTTNPLHVSTFHFIKERKTLSVFDGHQQMSFSVYLHLTSFSPTRDLILWLALDSKSGSSCQILVHAGISLLQCLAAYCSAVLARGSLDGTFTRWSLKESRAKLLFSFVQHNPFKITPLEARCMFLEFFRVSQITGSVKKNTKKPRRSQIEGH